MHEVNTDLLYSTGLMKMFNLFSICWKGTKLKQALCFLNIAAAILSWSNTKLLLQRSGYLWFFGRCTVNSMNRFFSTRAIGPGSSASGWW